MLPIKFVEDRAIVDFSSEFYYMYTVSEVCERFQHLAKFLVCFMKDQKIIRVVIKPKVDVDLKELTLEFCNHVLHEQAMLSK
jgi:hypothetical protein